MTQVPVKRNHFDEEEHQDEHQELVNILEEDKFHWSEVQRMHDQIKEVKGCATETSFFFPKNKVRRASSQARMMQQGGKP